MNTERHQHFSVMEKRKNGKFKRTNKKRNNLKINNKRNFFQCLAIQMLVIHYQLRLSMAVISYI